MSISRRTKKHMLALYGEPSRSPNYKSSLLAALLLFSTLQLDYYYSLKTIMNMDHVCLPPSRSKETAMLINEHFQALIKDSHKQNYGVSCF
jgi:hypothetical protein